MSEKYRTDEFPRHFPCFRCRSYESLRANLPFFALRPVAAAGSQQPPTMIIPRYTRIFMAAISSHGTPRAMAASMGTPQQTYLGPGDSWIELRWRSQSCHRVNVWPHWEQEVHAREFGREALAGVRLVAREVLERALRLLLTVKDDDDVEDDASEVLESAGEYSGVFGWVAHPGERVRVASSDSAGTLVAMGGTKTSPSVLAPGAVSRGA